MRYIFLLLTVFCVLAFASDNDVIIDKAEAKNAFAILTDIRTNPNNYHEELQFERDLKVSSMQLHWNDILAEVAERKAYDMASRNYFRHIDPEGYGINYFMAKAGYELDPEWTSDVSRNSFESITAVGPTGADAIKSLVKDADPSQKLGHRIALLGLNKWNAGMTDVGIGIARREKGSKYKMYTVVVLGRHSW